MSRTIHVLAVLGVLLAPGIALAQKEPPRPKELKDAEKFIATAQMAADTAERKSRFERALHPLQQAIAKDSNNALVWFAMGQAYAGLSDYARADSAFDRAEQLYAPIASDINNERLRAWGAALNTGVDMMEKQDYPVAIEYLEGAELMYAQRPESKINLAVLYSNKGDRDRSEEMFRAVLKLVDAPPTDLSAEEQGHWKRFKELSIVNLATSLGQRGVDAFEGKRYDDAIKAFGEAHQLNTQTRDFSYNLAESLFAKARAVEADREQLQEKGKAARAKKDVATANARAEEAKKLTAELNTIYSEMEPLIAHSLTKDPNNKDLYLLQLRSYQARGEFATEPAKKAEFQKRLNDLLAVHQALPVEISGITIGTAPGEATVKANLRNLKMTAGAPVKVRVMLLALDGGVIGQSEVPVNAPAVEQSAPFETKVAMTGELAGWKYEVVK